MTAKPIKRRCPSKAVKAFLIAVAICCLMLGPAGLGAADKSDNEYFVKWAELNSALVSFSTVSYRRAQAKGPPDPIKWGAALERERKRFADALARLTEMRPPQSQLMRHWKLMPLYEDLLAAMMIITAAVKNDDSTMEDRGWAMFRTVIARLRLTVADIVRRGE